MGETAMRRSIETHKSHRSHPFAKLKMFFAYTIAFAQRTLRPFAPSPIRRFGSSSLPILKKLVRIDKAWIADQCRRILSAVQAYSFREEDRATEPPNFG